MKIKRRWLYTLLLAVTLMCSMASPVTVQAAKKATLYVGGGKADQKTYTFKKKVKKITYTKKGIVNGKKKGKSVTFTAKKAGKTTAKILLANNKMQKVTITVKKRTANRTNIQKPGQPSFETQLAWDTGGTYGYKGIFLRAKNTSSTIYEVATFDYVLRDSAGHVLDQNTAFVSGLVPGTLMNSYDFTLACDADKVDLSKSTVKFKNASRSDVTKYTDVKKQVTVTHEVSYNGPYAFVYLSADNPTDKFVHVEINIEFWDKNGNVIDQTPKSFDLKAHSSDTHTLQRDVYGEDVDKFYCTYTAYSKG